MSSKIIDLLTWTHGGRPYSIEEFLDRHGNDLPAIILTATGFAGCDEGMHCVSADEAYWVLSCLKQKRILVKDEHARYLSIPFGYSRKFRIVNPEDKKDELVSIEQVTEMLKINSESPKVVLDRNPRVSFNLCAKSINNEKLGLLEVKEIYEMKYLLAHSICAESMLPETVVIPVYLDITMTVAIGCRYGGPEDFVNWMQNVNAIGYGFDASNAKLCEDLIMLSDKPINGQYEYVKPAKYKFDCDITNVQLLDQLIPLTNNVVIDDDNEITEQQQQPSTTMTTTTESITSSLEMSMEESSAPQSKSDQTCAMKLPQLPRRPLPVLPERDRYNRPDWIAATEFSGIPPEIPLEIPPEIPRRQKRRARSQRYVTIPQRQVPPHPPPPIPPPDLLSEATALVAAGSSSVCPRTISTPEVIARTISTPEVITKCDFSRSLVYAKKRDFIVKDCEDITKIPTDLDMTSLSTADLAHCLCLLSMWQHAMSFEDRDVDGSLLVNLDEEVLRNDFGFSAFDARKLMMFARGWRPRKR